MPKLLTFTWSMSVYAQEDFNPKSLLHFSTAQADAWDRIKRTDGELTDIKEIEEETTQ